MYTHCIKSELKLACIRSNLVIIFSYSLQYPWVISLILWNQLPPTKSPFQTLEAKAKIFFWILSFFKSMLAIQNKDVHFGELVQFIQHNLGHFQSLYPAVTFPSSHPWFSFPFSTLSASFLSSLHCFVYLLHFRFLLEVAKGNIELYNSDLFT